jgi:hypothetical protein
MILQIGADAGHVANDRYAEIGEMLRRADAGQLQELG